MKLICSWLKDFIELPADAKAVAEKLAALGFEVAGLASPATGLSNVVIGQLAAVTRHPNADRLRLCRVSLGDRELQVVTGATNVQEGDLVPVALVGATLAGGLTIKASKLRGEKSDGMLCSTAELNLAPSPEGVWVLPPGEFTPGADALAALGLDDTIIELEVPANRGDLSGVIGFARELAAAYRLPLRLPELTYPESEEEVRSAVKIGIAAPDLCERYCATVIRGAAAWARSPFWLERRLLLAGQRPLGLAVDITNYVLLEWGHPLHAFDLDRLAGPEIRVRRAAPGETAVTLDNVTRTLTAQMLVIADRDQPVALAGLMGCAGSGIAPETKDLLFESAWFNPGSVRTTARALKHQTASSTVFERGTDRLGLLPALRRATALLRRYAGGAVCRGVYDVLPNPFTRLQLTLRPERLQTVLGTAIDHKSVEAILAHLGFEFDSLGGKKIRVTVPSWRADVTREIDLVEEVARHHGYDQLAVQYPALGTETVAVAEAEFARRGLEDLLAARGWQQVITWSLQSPAARLEPSRPMVMLQNPLNPEMAGLRQHLVPGLLATLQHNFGYKSAESARVFELGRIFYPYETECLPKEEEHLALAAAGHHADWRGGEGVDFYDLKTEVEAILARLGRAADLVPGSYPFLQEGKAATVLAGGQPVGWLGVITDELKARYRLRHQTLVAELTLPPAAAPVPGSCRPISRFPAIERDLSLIIGEGVTAAELRAALLDQGGAWLEKIVLFDLYRGAPLAPGEKNLGYRFTFRAPDATLTDAQVNEVMDKLIRHLESQYGARVRR